jgi:hypothetical protein
VIPKKNISANNNQEGHHKLKYHTNKIIQPANPPSSSKTKNNTGNELKHISAFKRSSEVSEKDRQKAVGPLKKHQPDSLKFAKVPKKSTQLQVFRKKFRYIIFKI